MKDLKVFERLRLVAATMGVGFVLSNPMVTFAEETIAVGDILYEQDQDEHKQVDIVDSTTGNTGDTDSKDNTEDTEKKDSTEDTDSKDSAEDTEKKEFGKDEFIDDENWSSEIDADPNAGLTIPDTVQTEAEIKKLKPITPPQENPPKENPPKENPPKENPPKIEEPPIEQPPIIPPQMGRGIGEQVAYGIGGAIGIAAFLNLLEKLWETYNEDMGELVVSCRKKLKKDKKKQKKLK